MKSDLGTVMDQWGTPIEAALPWTPEVEAVLEALEWSGRSPHEGAVVGLHLPALVRAVAKKDGSHVVLTADLELDSSSELRWWAEDRAANIGGSVCGR